MPSKKESKGEATKVHYEASKVCKRASKGKSVLQFTLTITFSDGCAVTVRNCILGIGKNGPWCTAPLIKYRPVMFSKELCDKLIENFQKDGYLDDLIPPDWTEQQEDIVEWQE